MKQRILILLGWLVLCIPSFAQQEVEITIAQADSIFLRNNFSVLIAKYAIDASKAAKLQAKIWDNPNLLLEGNVYNPATSKVFPYNNIDPNNPQGGAINIQLQQQISLSAQRHRMVNMMQTGVAIQEQTFIQTLRDVRAGIHSSMYNLYYLHLKLELLQKQIAVLDTLYMKFRVQAAKGIISSYDATRLEIELKDNQNNLLDISKQYHTEQSNLKALLALNTTDMLMPIINDEFPKTTIAVSDWVNTAITNRSELKIADQNRVLMRQTLSYQRSLALPKTTLGFDYQRFGSVYKDFMGVQLATDLPVFNRNQGNIAIAKAMEKQSQVGYNSVQNAIVNEVVSEINHYSEVMKLMNVDLSAYDKEISTIQMNAAKAFAERQINMVDFIDKLRSTLLAKNNNLELKQNYINTAISINQATETNIFPIK